MNERDQSNSNYRKGRGRGSDGDYKDAVEKDGY